MRENGWSFRRRSWKQGWWQHWPRVSTHWWVKQDLVNHGSQPKQVAAQQQAETKVEQLEQLRKVMERQMSEMLAERDNEKVRGDQLQRQLNKLRAEAKSGQRSVNLALRKLTQSPLVAKRLAAACHPDKVPSELSDVATELFRFVQSIRDDR